VGGGGGIGRIPRHLCTCAEGEKGGAGDSPATVRASALADAELLPCEQGVRQGRSTAANRGNEASSRLGRKAASSRSTPKGESLSGGSRVGIGAGGNFHLFAGGLQREEQAYSAGARCLKSSLLREFSANPVFVCCSYAELYNKNANC